MWLLSNLEFITYKDMSVITGYKMSQAVCRNRVTGIDMDAKLCNAAQQPEPQVVECNTHRCPPKWVLE